MKLFIVFAAIFTAASTGPLQVDELGDVAPVPIFLANASVPVISVSIDSDEIGQYSYGYAGGSIAKTEFKAFDGITRGVYTYTDVNGDVQLVQYSDDPVNGFQVTASNLPEDTPEVKAAKVAHALAHAAASANPAAITLVQIDDTPEVKAAKAEHARVHAAASANPAATTPVQIDDTPEVEVAKAHHALAHAQAATRTAVSGSSRSHQSNKLPKEFSVV